MDYKDVLRGHNPGNFWTLSKINLLDVLIKQHLTTRDHCIPLKILNLGAGVGNDIAILNKYGIVDVLDINAKAIDMIPKKRVNSKVMANATNMPYPECTFDVVISFDLFEHIKDDEKAMTDAKRVLKDGGLLLVTVPAHPRLYSKHDQLLGHFRRYDKKHLTEKLDGFTRVNISYWNAFLFPFVVIHRALLKEQELEQKVAMFPRLVNLFLYNILKIESYVLGKGRKVPFGLTLVAECIK